MTTEIIKKYKWLIPYILLILIFSIIMMGLIYYNFNQSTSDNEVIKPTFDIHGNFLCTVENPYELELVGFVNVGVIMVNYGIKQPTKGGVIYLSLIFFDYFSELKLVYSITDTQINGTLEIEIPQSLAFLYVIYPLFDYCPNEIVNFEIQLYEV